MLSYEKHLELLTLVLKAKGLATVCSHDGSCDRQLVNNAQHLRNPGPPDEGIFENLERVCAETRVHILLLAAHQALEEMRPELDVFDVVTPPR